MRAALILITQSSMTLLMVEDVLALICGGDGDSERSVMSWSMSIVVRKNDNGPKWSDWSSFLAVGSVTDRMGISSVSHNNGGDT